MLNEGFDLTNSVEKSISAAMHSKRFPHAVIIEGGSSEERMSLAQKTAAALVCSGGGSAVVKAEIVKLVCALSFAMA